MRVMFTTWPEMSEYNPMIPLTWAFQGAGHEVRVVSHPGLAKAITSTGLTAVSLNGTENLPRPDTVTDFVIGDEELAQLTEALALDPADRRPWDIFSYYLIAAHRIFFPVSPTEQPMVDDLVDFARGWQPDLVIWDVTWPCGGVAALACGAASARLLWGPDYCAWTNDRFAERKGLLGPGVQNPLVQVVRPMADRYQLEVTDDMLVGHWTIDPIPEDARLPTTTRKVRMRRLPYTGAGVLPEWLRSPPERPRVALTLGVSQRTNDKDSAVLIADMLDMVAGLDIEAVATLNDDQLAGQRVPSNVRTIDYVPLTQLLPTCSAIVHHGSGGTFATAVAHKVPQLILDQSMDAPGYTRCVTGHGAGLGLDHNELSVAEMRARLQRVLTEPSFQKGVHDLYCSWLSLPSPNEILLVLEKLTDQHRDRH
ncbi:MAG: DUF1205 domain-containing protein [Pseudonocardiaceae bacterium]|nr:DUF1205 domain-containing protein [Pseudonocardiaceae bacterium]